MFLSSSDTPLLREAIQKYPQYLGWILTPRVWYARRSLREINGRWAGDNDCFNAEHWDAERFVDFLKRQCDVVDQCLFVAAPDVVGDATATLQRYGRWHDIIAEIGYPVAFVAQDGLTTDCTPWDSLDCLFIGGSTEWKLSQKAVRLIEAAKEHNKWVHVGRVNSRQRMLFCYNAGVDSVDGTAIAYEPDNAVRWILSALREFDAQQVFDLSRTPDQWIERQ